jgi:hypothetical protein
MSSISAKKLIWPGQCSRLEDELSFWVGPVVVKFARLFINLGVSIHLFSCAYWRIKVR